MSEVEVIVYYSLHKTSFGVFPSPFIADGKRNSQKQKPNKPSV